MPRQSHVETIEAQGCQVVLRRVEGPEAQEIFLLGQPPAALSRPGEQAEAIYRAIFSVLEAEGGDASSITCETVFLRNLQTDLEAVRAARQGALSTREGSALRRPTTEIGQAPLNESAALEVQVQAVLPHSTALRSETLEVPSACTCAECASAYGLRVPLGDEIRLHVGALYGKGEGAYEQTHGMFQLAEEALQQAGMEFTDVVRTWIHLREMDRDYADLNRARREFFEARGIDPAPASTGIGGSPVPGGHDLCLGLYAIQSAPKAPAAERAIMTTPTLNEAPVYGSDFARGMRIDETNKVALHVSGTASIDETGETVHVGDFDAQVDRMLVNVGALLEGQGASFGDVVSGITYVKHAADATRLREKFQDAGFVGFPNVLVEAAVCRPELLCETEVLAVLPKVTTPHG